MRDELSKLADLYDSIPRKKEEQNELLKRAEVILSTRTAPYMYAVAVVLEEEYAALEVVFPERQEYVTTNKIPVSYEVVELPTCSTTETEVSGKEKLVVIAQVHHMGTNAAAVAATSLLMEFLNLRAIVLVGIAGGVPQDDKDENDVRLGDIVVSKSLIQYDM